MGKKIFIVVIIFITSSFQNSLYGFDNERTHPALTQRAVGGSACILDDYLKTQLGMTGGLTTELYWDFPSSIKARMDKAEPDRTTRSISDWLKAGSIIEDDPIGRTRNHFHDPTRNSGLDNTEKANLLRYAFYTGDSAKEWAINHTSNEFDWQAAREDFYFALTDPNRADREMFLAEMFLRLGHILHMLEDMGVPAHARNDSLFAHVRNELFKDGKGNPLEMWIEKKIASDGSLARWISPSWTPSPQIYSKVSSYFDANAYTGNYLGDGVPTPGNWGLAEKTNYQFLSWTTIFNEDFLTSLYYFPHPARIHTVDVNESGRIYLSGYGVNHLARKTMSFHNLQHDHLDKAWCVLGSAIYDDYAAITLPRTINYAAGLVNYFFRGRLSVEAECIECDVFELTITNKSDNSGTAQTLKGGDFELYWEDAAGNRAEVPDFGIDGGWTSSSTLAYDGTVTAAFTKPTAGEPVKYILVYRGNICENLNQPDADDENAIAVIVFTSPSDNCCIKLYDTGVDDNYEPIAIGDTDTHYIVGGNAKVNYPYFPPEWGGGPVWFAPPEGTNAQWIEPVNYKTVAEFDFYLYFEVPESLLDTFRLQGSWSVDNTATMYINDNATPVATLPNETFRPWKSPVPFAILSGFVAGQNYIRFHVVNVVPPPIDAPENFCGLFVHWYKYYDDDPPSPNPSLWASTPIYFYDGTFYYHTMTAVEATDDSPPVYYRFECTFGAGTSSGWQTSPTYNAGPYLVSNYSVYRVYTKDAVGNIGSPSEEYDTNGQKP